MTFRVGDRVRISNSYLADEAPEGAWGYIEKHYKEYVYDPNQQKDEDEDI